MKALLCVVDQAHIRPVGGWPTPGPRQLISMTLTGAALGR